MLSGSEEKVILNPLEESVLNVGLCISRSLAVAGRILASNNIIDTWCQSLIQLQTSCRFVGRDLVKDEGRAYSEHCAMRDRNQ
jgi:hypothetical protein